MHSDCLYIPCDKDVKYYRQYIETFLRRYNLSGMRRLLRNGIWSGYHTLKKEVEVILDNERRKRRDVKWEDLFENELSDIYTLPGQSLDLFVAGGESYI
ncbi:hypothetical protein TWF506_001587 [Arthrobotrys conoides]|uniref:Uncharacterized protein n=1 Tax=Arthrobotrys conoides TaxID=74498 RepID=A0AAN8P2I7_9PEZI